MWCHRTTGAMLSSVSVQGVCIITVSGGWLSRTEFIGKRNLRGGGESTQ